MTGYMSIIQKKISVNENGVCVFIHFLKIFIYRVNADNCWFGPLPRHWASFLSKKKKYRN